MNIFLLSLVLVAAASAQVIREEEDNCFTIAGVNLCGDLPISGKRDELDKRILPCYYIDGVRTCIGIKREEDLNLAASKRKEQDVDLCVNMGCTRFCPSSDTNIMTNICRKDAQDVDVATCLTINGVRTCLPFIRREEDLNLAEIVANIGKVVQVIDGFISGAAAKREEQDVDVCFTFGCTRYCPSSDTNFTTNICKKDAQDVDVATCLTINAVRTCLPFIRREEDLNLAEIVANIGKVVQVIDGFISGAAAKREEQDVAPCITSGCFRICMESGEITNICKREEQYRSLPPCVIYGINICQPILTREEQDFDTTLCWTVNGNKICGPIIKREEQDLDTTLCWTVNGNKICGPIIRREENLNLAEIIADIGKVISSAMF